MFLGISQRRDGDNALYYAIAVANVKGETEEFGARGWVLMRTEQ